MNETCRYLKTHKDGRIEFVHIWPTGWQILIAPDMEAFERWKAANRERNQ